MSNKNENKKDDFIMDKGAELNTEELNDVSGGFLYRGAAGGIASDDAGLYASKDDEVEAGVQYNVEELAAALVGKQSNRITKKLNG